MAISTTILFNQPQCQIIDLLRQELERSQRTQIVTGFLTVEGVQLLFPALTQHPSNLDTLVLGAGTYRAFEGLDRLLAIGVPIQSLKVHLGHSRPTKEGATHKFYRYHPMLHSKVYYMEHDNGKASAFIGSHNLTGFALAGLNGEASVLIEGDASSTEFDAIRAHITEARRQSVNYDPNQKEALAWWSKEAFEGIRDKVNDAPRDTEAKKTLVLLVELDDSKVPKKGDIIYFELPSELVRISSLDSEVHVYVFKNLPSNPRLALQSLDLAVASYWCRTIGIELGRGGVELRADWQISNDARPNLSLTVHPFRPQTAIRMQQVRVQVYYGVRDKYDYLFGKFSKKWLPVFDDNQYQQSQHSNLNTPNPSTIRVDESISKVLADLELMPNQEHLPWFPVRGLVADTIGSNDTEESSKILNEFSPESGSFVMLSLRRRKILT
jgi:HKD family nuclease